MVGVRRGHGAPGNGVPGSGHDVPGRSRAITPGRSGRRRTVAGMDDAAYPDRAPYISALRFVDAAPAPGEEWVEGLAVVKHLRALGRLPLPAPVTLLAGDNGMGKSTLLEAIAALAGLNPDGGSRFMRFSLLDDASPLHRRLGLVRRENPRDAYFLRAESHLRLLREIDDHPPPRGPSSYGDVPLHRMSHGESVWAMVVHRFGDGLYLLDEPEAGLSPMRQMALLAKIDELARGGAQFIIATHSPILLAIPRAVIFELSDDGLRVVDWDACGAVADMREFLDAPEETVAYLTEHGCD